MKKINLINILGPGAIISMLVLLSGCVSMEAATTPTIKTVEVSKMVYVTKPLPLPSRPTLPKWHGKDMNCLPESMKQNIRDRDRMMKDYAIQLENVIKSTHQPEPTNGSKETGVKIDENK